MIPRKIRRVTVTYDLDVSQRVQHDINAEIEEVIEAGARYPGFARHLRDLRGQVTGTVRVEDIDETENDE